MPFLCHGLGAWHDTRIAIHCMALCITITLSSITNHDHTTLLLPSVTSSYCCSWPATTAQWLSSPSTILPTVHHLRSLSLASSPTPFSNHCLFPTQGLQQWPEAARKVQQSQRRHWPAGLLQPSRRWLDPHHIPYPLFRSLVPASNPCSRTPPTTAWCCWFWT